MILVRTILALHDSGRSPLGLVGSLGDARLCDTNPVYRNVRRAMLALDCTFDAGLTSAASRVHRAIPLLALEEIVDAGIVPYVDNVVPLRSLAALVPTTAFSMKYLMENVTRNKTLHEGAHCVAHRCLFGAERLRTVAARAPERCAFALFLAEAFANTVELFASAHSREAGDALLFALSSYFAFDRKNLKLVQRTIDSLGERAAFELALLCYLAANVAGPESTPQPSHAQAVHRVARELGMKVRAQSVATLLTNAFHLSAYFRGEVSNLVLRSLGIAEAPAAAARAMLASSASVRWLAGSVTALAEVLDLGDQAPWISGVPATHAALGA